MKEDVIKLLNDFEANVKIPEEDIIRHIGGTPNSKIESHLNTIQNKFTKIIEPDITYAHYPKDELYYDEWGRRINKVFDTCDQSVWFIATLGKKFDQKVKSLMKKNKYMDAYLLDILGSIGIENLVNSFHHEFEAYFEDFDRGVTLRFSPGYCDWNLEEQRTVFELVDTEEIGVDLTESCLMVPSKSVSGVFGVTAEPCKSVTNSNPCLRCGKKDCNMRREVSGGVH